MEYWGKWTVSKSRKERKKILVLSKLVVTREWECFRSIITTVIVIITISSWLFTNSFVSAKLFTLKGVFNVFFLVSS